MNSITIKNEARALGVVFCGIAPVERFVHAPSGFGPRDLYPETRSVVAFALPVPSGSLDLPSIIPYHVVEEITLHESHRIAYRLAIFLEMHGFRATMVPSEPYEYWDEDRKTGKGLVSLKHIGYQCGLGVFGKNQLLCNPGIGNLMKLGAVLTNAELEPDAILDIQTCRPGCRLCIDSCPSGALSETGVDQLKCRAYSHQKTAKGDMVYVCNVCRKVCVNARGVKKLKEKGC
jgi:epoxyqueuosine reductase